jgi:hypothetical protein
MEKKTFERFIAKYNLGGSCESVIYNVTDDSRITTRAISDDKNVLCEVTGPSMGIPAGDYAVYDTGRLRSLLGVLDEQLSVRVKSSGDRPVGMTLSDSSTEVTFVLADTTVIPSVPDLKTLPLFQMNIVLDETFINTFVKAKGALSEVDTFTVMSDGHSETANIVLGFSSLNTNRIKLTANTTEAVALEPISFSAKYLREILVANKDAKGGHLMISSKGLAKTTFSADGVDSTYYLVQIDTKD